MEMKQNEDLDESSKKFSFSGSQYQRKFKTCLGTIRHMQFCKEISQFIKDRELERL